MTYFPEHDFRSLIDLSHSNLLDELAWVHTELANKIEEVAYLRADDLRAGNKSGSPDRAIAEGQRDVLIEKKYLIIRLLDNASP